MHNVQQPKISDSTDNSSNSATPETPDVINDLLTRLKSEPEKNQLPLVQELANAGDAGLEALMSFLQERQSQLASAVDGTVYQVLAAANTAKTQEFLQTYFSQGVVPLKSERSIDYSPLQIALTQQDFQTADRLTLEKMCELAGAAAVQRKWLYFTEVETFPTTDLQTINLLWLVHSEGKFGFSVQRELWLGVGKNWDILWPKIGWKTGNSWTRYPQEFIWSLSAPRGHLPLSNQLRGVRVIASLLSHPAWNQ